VLQLIANPFMSEVAGENASSYTPRHCMFLALKTEQKIDNSTAEGHATERL
jgi:hypothetical protein